MERHTNSCGIILTLPETAEILSDMHCYKSPQIKKNFHRSKSTINMQSRKNEAGLKWNPASLSLGISSIPKSKPHEPTKK